MQHAYHCFLFYSEMCTRHIDTLDRFAGYSDRASSYWEMSGGQH